MSQAAASSMKIMLDIPFVLGPTRYQPDSPAGGFCWVKKQIKSQTLHKMNTRKKKWKPQSGGSESYPNLSMSIDTFNRTAPHEQNHVCSSKPSDEFNFH